MKITEENIWKEAIKGNCQIINSPLIDKKLSKDITLEYDGKDLYIDTKRAGITIGKLEKSFYRYFLNVDIRGGHFDGNARPSRIIIFPKISMTIAKNTTPMQLLAIRGLISKRWLKKRYPWFKIGFWKKVTPDLIDQILNTSKAEMFIYEVNL